MSDLIKIILLASFMTPPAQAGGVKDFCRRAWSRVIDDDPTQYEDIKTGYLITRLSELNSKYTRGRLDQSGINHRDIIGQELRHRLAYGYLERDEIKQIGEALGPAE